MSAVPPHDVLIIGSGAAGLTAALTLAEHCRVLVLAKGPLTSGSTAWAQGGIAAVLDAGDTFANHIEDTMVAGAGLNLLPKPSNVWRSWGCRSTPTGPTCT